MTQEQLKDLRIRLLNWCCFRHLNEKKQKPSLLGNILEELTEFVRAQDEHEQIDALCDIAVFYLNANPKQEIILGYAPAVFGNLRIVERVLSLIFLRTGTAENVPNFCFNNIKSRGYDPYKCMDETIKEIESRRGQYNNEIKKFIKDAGAYSLGELQKKFANEPECSITDNGDSFVVRLGNAETSYVKWYKADYSKCKLEKQPKKIYKGSFNAGLKDLRAIAKQRKEHRWGTK